jgi:hypothetical protein
MIAPAVARLRSLLDLRGLWTESTSYVAKNAPSLANMQSHGGVAIAVDRARRLWDQRPWSTRFVLRYLVAIALFIFVVVHYASFDFNSPAQDGDLAYGGKHPIKELMAEAGEIHREKLSRRSYDMYAAASRYRARRGRHPPPGFDRWLQAAFHSDAVVVEDYYDRIYKDLAPFWAMDIDVIRRRANDWHWVVRVRNGTAFGDGNTEGKVPWLQLWTGLVEEFAEYMPDVDMPINDMDEPRLLVPFDKIAKLVETERKERILPKAEEVMSTYKGLEDIDAGRRDAYEPEWHGPDNAYWDLAVKTCGPDTPAYGVPAVMDYSQRPEFPVEEPDYAYQGFIWNWTAATDPCLQPHLRQLHGTFVEPISLSSTEELIPMFGGSKLPMNNEILIPGAMYLTDDPFYSGGKGHGPEWKNKRDGLVWRGDASGGRPKPESWTHFHRHRLVDMLTPESVARAESSPDGAATFELPSTSVYKSLRLRDGQLAAWIRKIANVGFVHMCPPGMCDWIFEFYKETASVPMEQQYEYKLLPDVDGNSFSARFRGFMLSTSAPIKATIYSEWHDDRLVPWVHFIPMDNTFRDLYPLLEFFADASGTGDRAAELIADAGRNWANQVLRREDMKLYVWRLLLEWARVCDENRHSLGWVQDLDSGLGYAP